MQLTHALHRTGQQYPDRIATIYGDRTRTFAESIDRISRLGGALRSLGVQEGDRVGILALNSDRYHEYLLAVPWIGAAVNPVNIRWAPAEIAYSLADSGTRVLLVDDAFAKLAPLLREQYDQLETVIFIGEGPTPDDALNYEALIEGSAPVEDTRTGGDSLWGVLYTGGTTGHPKGVMLSHKNLLASATGLLVIGGITRSGRALHAAPMFHIAALTLWAMANLVDSTHVIIPRFSPLALLDAVEKHQVTDTLLVPTMIQMLADAPEVDRFDLSTLRHVLYGGSPISEAVLERASKALPRAGFSQSYGMTELSTATWLNSVEHHDATLLRSCGRPAPHADLRVVDSHDDEVPRGAIGEITVRGDNVMLGYWNRPDETAATVRDGWMHTGDCGFMDEHGYVFVVDRLKDMIITGGENVYSVEVENAIAQHPAVAASAVIGLPDPQWGERVHAVVVLLPGVEATEEEVREHCRALIAGYKAPRSVEFVDALPVSGAGKVLKRELRERAQPTPA